MAQLLVAYDSLEGQTRKIAEFLGSVVREAGHEAEVLDLGEIVKGPGGIHPDGLIVGASIHLGKHSRRFVSFVRQNKAWLEQWPTGFFSVSLSASGSEEEREQARRYVAELLDETGWYPDVTETLAGGLMYRQYGFLKRWIMRSIAGKAGRPTDTSQDHEFTDWDHVRGFAHNCLRQFGIRSGTA
ncbi:MAG: hypothetical protein MUF48_15125 [Pirellulaceae bacterium]|jgi:menaquinone-dependent protoporphyrinogen oxidase|nr:hypothetical protein [Pirellulaceae bacterium]